LAWNRATASFFANFDFRPGDQIQWLVTHPLNYASVLVRTAAPRLASWAMQVFGGFGFCREASIGAPLTILGVATFSAAVLLDARQEIEIAPWQRIIALMTALMTSLLIVTALYLINPRGADTVRGIAGRYFIPVIPIYCVGLYQRRISLRIRPERFGWLLPVVVIGLTLATLIAIARRYYV